jgi:RimJ/RimL family protein N-acetyltransferase
MADAPDILTPRLSFHRPEAADFEESAAMWADAATTRHIGGTPSSREESWARLLRQVGHWALYGYGYWVVRHRKTEAFVGEVGLKQFRRCVVPELETVPEIGWILLPGTHGQGLATEAAAAALAWGDAHFAWSITACLIDPDNTASIRVAEKCGYRNFATVSYKEQSTLIMTREKPES